MYNSFGKYKTTSHVQVFIGLCMACCFIILSKNYKCFAYDPIPTPSSISSYISLEFDIYSNSNDTDNSYHSLGFNFDRYSIPSSRLGDGSSFYYTFYRYAIQSALDNLNNDKGYNLSISNTVLDLFLSKFDDIYNFDPLCPQVLMNTFIDSSGNIYFVPDYNTNVLLTGNSLNDYYKTSQYGQACVPSGLRPFMFFGEFYYDYNPAGYRYFVGYAQPYTDNPNNVFCLGSNVSSSLFNIAFQLGTYHSYSDFNSLSFYSLNYSNPSDMHSYGFVNNQYVDCSGFSSRYLYPLVIMSSIYTRGNPFYYITDYQFDCTYYNGSYICYGLNPQVNVNSFQYDFIVPANLWASNGKWTSRYSTGLSYSSSIIDDPAVLYTPTPFPTLNINATLTPIILPLDPDISGFDNGDIFGTVSGYISLLVSVLDGPIPRFFSEVISYIYSSSFVFYIMLFVPIVIFISFIIGRLHRK